MGWSSIWFTAGTIWTGQLRKSRERTTAETNLGRRVIEQFLEVLDTEIGDSNVLYLASGRQLLHLLPCLNEIPIWEVLLQIGGVGRAWPMYKIQINVIDAQRLQRGVNSLLNALVPWVIELGSKPDLLSWDTRILDAKSDLSLVFVGKLVVDQHSFLRWGSSTNRSINVTVSFPQGNLNGLLNFTGLRLPGSKSNGWNLRSRVQGERLSV